MFASSVTIPTRAPGWILRSRYTVMKLNCEKWRELASEYIEGTLAEPMARAMREHASACDTCRADEVALRSLMEEISALPEVDPPMYFHENVMAAVERAQKEKPVGPWWETLLPRVFRTATGTLLVGAVASAALLAFLMPRNEKSPSGPVVAGTQSFSLLPGASRETDDKPAQEPRLRIARKTIELAGRGQTMEFSFWLEDARSGNVRFDIAGVKDPFTFDLTPGVRKTLQIPYDVAGGKATLDLQVKWAVDGERHARTLIVPIPSADADPQPVRQTYQQSSADLWTAARTVAARYGVPVTLENVPAELPVSVDARNETAGEALQRAVAPHGLTVASSQAGVLVQSAPVASASGDSPNR